VSTVVQGRAFCEASRQGDLQLVQLLLEHQADVNATDADGKTALELAGNFEEIKCALLMSGRLHSTPQSMVGALLSRV